MAKNESKDHEEKISLFLSNDEIYVWDKTDLMILRKNYRIVGSLVGSLPSKPRQNLVFSLPLHLMAEEAQLLLEKNVAKVVKSVYSIPSAEMVSIFNEERKFSVNDQTTRLQRLKEEKHVDLVEIIEERRRTTKRKQRSFDTSESTQQQKKCCLVTNSDKFTLDHSKPFDTSIEQFHLNNDKTHEETRELKVDHHHGLSKKNGNSSSVPHTNNIVNEDSTLICVTSKTKFLQTEVVDWKFPYNEVQRIRYKVFCDLWEKGYFITNGNKFGGDFLVYPGDPLRYHSHFVVKILREDEKLNGQNLIAVGRLGSTVKKTSVLASIDSVGDVNYVSLQWSGFS